jgi:hypothetical protein
MLAQVSVIRSRQIVLYSSLIDRRTNPTENCFIEATMARKFNKLKKNSFPKKLALGFQKYEFGSGIPDPGVKKTPDPGSRIRIRNTAKNTKTDAD